MRRFIERNHRRRNFWRRRRFKWFTVTIRLKITHRFQQNMKISDDESSGNRTNLKIGFASADLFILSQPLHDSLARHAVRVSPQPVPDFHKRQLLHTLHHFLPDAFQIDQTVLQQFLPLHFFCLVRVVALGSTNQRQLLHPAGHVWRLQRGSSGTERKPGAGRAALQTRDELQNTSHTVFEFKATKAQPTETVKLGKSRFSRNKKRDIHNLTFWTKNWWLYDMENTCFTIQLKNPHKTTTDLLPSLFFPIGVVMQVARPLISEFWHR